MKEKILICTSTFAEFDRTPLDLLEKQGYDITDNPFHRTLTGDEIIMLGKDCTGIISGSEQLNQRVLASLPNLACISRVGVGTDNIDLEYARQRNITVRNTPEAPTRAVAELTISLILDLLRGVSRHDRMVRNGVWKKEPGYLLCGKKVGIIGLGRIGRAVAVLLAGMGARVSGTDLYPDRAWAAANGIELKDFSRILKECDIVTVHVPFTKENASLIGEREIRAMKKGSFLLNVSRGGIVDEAALYEALKENRLAGAAVDTFATEPYHGNLATLESVVLTPHMGSYTVESRSAMELEAVQNLIAGLSSR